MGIKNEPFKASQIPCLGSDNWIHPWQNMDGIDQSNRPIIQNAKGIYIYDENGHELIDGQGGMWCVQIGYGRQEMAEAIAKQVTKMSYMSPFSMTSVPSDRLAEKLADIAPGDLTQIFFTTGGSTAVDTAIRFVNFYNKIKNRPNKNQIIACSHSYHGSTFLSASVSSRDHNDSYFTQKPRNVHFLPLVDLAEHESVGSIENYCAQKVSEFEQKILEIGVSRICAFIAEPIQASGGIIIPPPGYLAQCRELCRKYDILYISDEVVTGFGRLGHWFSSTPIFKVQPDILICAKGLSSGYLPIGAVIFSEQLIKDIENRHIKDLKLALGFTYSGHPVCCAAALKNIEIIEREGILEHVQKIGGYFQNKLLELKDLPGVIDIQGMGLLAGIHCDLPNKNDNAKNFIQLISTKCKESGLLVRNLSDKLILSPPLVITLSEVDILVNRLRLGIEMALNEIRVNHV